MSVHFLLVILNKVKSSSNIKQSKISLKKKESDGFKLPSLGSLFNPKFEDVNSEDLIDLYYF